MAIDANLCENVNTSRLRRWLGPQVLGSVHQLASYDKHWKVRRDHVVNIELSTITLVYWMHRTNTTPESPRSSVAGTSG